MLCDSYILIKTPDHLMCAKSTQCPRQPILCLPSLLRMVNVLFFTSDETRLFTHQSKKVKKSTRIRKKSTNSFSVKRYSNASKKSKRKCTFTGHFLNLFGEKNIRTRSFRTWQVRIFLFKDKDFSVKKTKS